MECQGLNDALEAASAGADIVMIDNHTPAALGLIATQLKHSHPHILVEASGVSRRGFYLVTIIRDY